MDFRFYHKASIRLQQRVHSFLEKVTGDQLISRLFLLTWTGKRKKSNGYGLIQCYLDQISILICGVFHFDRVRQHPAKGSFLVERQACVTAQGNDIRPLFKSHTVKSESGTMITLEFTEFLGLSHRIPRKIKTAFTVGKYLHWIWRYLSLKNV